LSPQRRPPWRTVSPATASRAVAILLTYLALLGILAGLVGLIVPLLADEFVLLRDNGRDHGRKAHQRSQCLGQRYDRYTYP